MKASPKRTFLKNLTKYSPCSQDLRKAKGTVKQKMKAFVENVQQVINKNVFLSKEYEPIFEEMPEMVPYMAFGVGFVR